MFDPVFPARAQASGVLAPAASAGPSCASAALAASSPDLLAPAASASGAAAEPTTGRADSCAEAASASDASLAYQTALRRQLLALLGDEPTGHPQSQKLP